MPNRVREVRVLQRISQYVIANKTGIPQSRLSLIENDLARPREKERVALAQALEVTVETLFPSLDEGR